MFTIPTLRPRDPASNPTTLQIIDDPTSPTGRAFANDDPARSQYRRQVRFRGNLHQTLCGWRKQLRYGQVNALIKVAGGPGAGADSVWPAFWMLGDNINSVGWPTCGEIDIMETNGSNENQNYEHIHCPSTGGGDVNGGAGVGAFNPLPGGGYMYSGYHLYGIDWSPNSITWSIDGVPVLTETPTSSNFTAPTASGNSTTRTSI